MMNFRTWQPYVDQPDHSFPGNAGFLASTLERIIPVPPYLKSKCIHRRLVCRDSKIPVVPSNHRLEPLSHDWNRLVHPSFELGLDLLKFGSHFLPDGFAD